MKKLLIAALLVAVSVGSVACAPMAPTYKDRHQEQTHGGV